MKRKQIAILGSTGSIGTQALQVIEDHPDLYEVYALTAHNSVDLLAKQARKFHPDCVIGYAMYQMSNHGYAHLLIL